MVKKYEKCLRVFFNGHTYAIYLFMDYTIFNLKFLPNLEHTLACCVFAVRLSFVFSRIASCCTICYVPLVASQCEINIFHAFLRHFSYSFPTYLINWPLCCNMTMSFKDQICVSIFQIHHVDLISHSQIYNQFVTPKNETTFSRI